MTSRRLGLFFGGSALLLALTLSPHVLFAQTTSLLSDVPVISNAVVERVLSTERADTVARPPYTYVREVEARFTSGEERGETVVLKTYFTEGDGKQIQEGDGIFVARYGVKSEPGEPAFQYSMMEFDRMWVVVAFILLFVFTAILVGGKQGIRGLLSLVAGLAIIVFLMLPGITHGYSPLLLSVLVASFVATIGAYITHGVSRMTTAAVIGMVVTIVLATLLAALAVELGHLTTVFTDDDAYYLLTTPSDRPAIGLQGLLLSGMIIGLLGVLYDAAIGQAVAVEELARVGPHLPRRLIFQRAFRIGREHIGSIVNTLVLAYVGVSLPTLIMLYESLRYAAYSPPLLNSAFLATEIVRTSVGSTGLILAIPITTWVAVRMIVKEPTTTDSTTLSKEKAAIEHVA